MQNLSFLFAGYSVTWVVLFLYIFSLWRRQNRMARELRDLQEKMAATEEE